MHLHTDKMFYKIKNEFGDNFLLTDKVLEGGFFNTMLDTMTETIQKS